MPHFQNDLQVPFQDDPKRFIADFYTSFTEEILHSGDDPGAIVDRFHEPGFVQVADGNVIDREKLTAHLRPVRKNVLASRMEVHDALVDGDLLAARYTLHVTGRKGDTVSDVHFFGRFAPDGRMREAHVLSRTRRVDAADPADAATVDGG
ncbi:nuclear transport factor 2 family protein [Streptomyces sp. NPDC020412]|uniref:nuclear transport factor 2 family protein n=1 Tax=Streptomyces sp. NPDC020412 TaxID=3365073 RepID=UPI0037924586